MKEIMANDRRDTYIAAQQSFGLMQITRQRVRPALDITTTRSVLMFRKRRSAAVATVTDTLKEN